MQPKLDQILEILQKENVSEELQRSFLETLGKALAMQMYVSLAQVLNEEEMKELESMGDDSQREEKMITIFKEKVGHDPQQLSDKFIEVFTKEFIENYHKERASLPS